jgi:hypothetical protein
MTLRRVNVRKEGGKGGRKGRRERGTDLSHEAVQVELLVAGDGNVVGPARDRRHLLHAAHVDLVVDVEAADVAPVAFDHVDQLVNGDVLA